MYSAPFSTIIPDFGLLNLIILSEVIVIPLAMIKVSFADMIPEGTIPLSHVEGVL